MEMGGFNESIYGRVVEEVYRSLENATLREGLKRTIDNLAPAPYRVIGNWGYLVKLAEELRRVKEEVLKNIDYYIDLTLKSVREYARGEGFYAKTMEDVYKIVDMILEGHRRRMVIVKAKSMVTEELRLREYLIEKGHEVYETDLGELLIQLSQGKPMHAIAPAIHIPREEAVRLINKLGVNTPMDATHDVIVRRVREFLREKFTKADVGISGANAVAADTGSIVLIENEGNIRLSTSLPPVHIAITGIEKIMPTLDYAIKQALVQSAYAGLYPPTYLTVISGPSSTADIEYRRVYGAHGPHKFYLILYDGGRRRALESPYLWEQLLCIRCGRCQGECPVWMLTANSWGGSVYGGPMGMAWVAITEDEVRAAHLALLCLQCGRCKDVCPMKIDMPKIAYMLKKSLWHKTK
jgi:L-lactate dehydrogenase complex protein LldG